MPGPEHDQIAEEINRNTIELRLKGWVDNFKDNLPNINGGYGISSLISSLDSVPVIIIGSGPTLDKNIEQLQGLENKAMLICAASALAALQIAGIRPHFALMSDSWSGNTRSLDGVNIPEYNFVLDTFVHPEIVERLKPAKRIYWYNSPAISGCEFTGILSQWTGAIGNMASGGCGATACWSFATTICGCNPDILVGLPEAYYDSEKHYSDAVMATHAVTIYDTTVEQVMDNYGNPCYTNKAYKSFKLWFEDAFLRIPGVHINCSEGGIIREGCLVMSLEECKKRFLNTEYDIESMLFAKEKLVEEYTRHVSEDVSIYKPFLTLLIGTPSIPELSVRMGWTHQKIAQTVIDLRELGVKISEKAVWWQPPQEERQQTLLYTLEPPDVK
jgi:hypothetical protein